MMRFSLIKNGVVENIIIADTDFIVGYAKDNGYDYVDFDQNPDALIGATTADNITFDTSTYKKAEDNLEPQTVEPSSVTGMQEI
jgi:hypothetical protein